MLRGHDCRMQCTPADVARLDVIVSELDRLVDRLAAVTGTVRGLEAGTRWRARAASAFHDRAQAYACDVSALGGLSEQVRSAARRARWVTVLSVDWAGR